MLNPVLRNGLLPEHRIIYDAKIPLTDETIKERIRNSVQHIRKAHRKAGVNKAEAKLKKYGNNGGWYIERVKEAVKTLYKQKAISKKSIGLWRSIEFELIFKSKADREAFGYAVRNAGLSEYVTIQEDKSIKLNQHDMTGVTNEIVISYRTGDEDAVRKFCKCLKGRAYVNWSCGTHFHFDMRHLRQDDVVLYGNRLAQAVPVLRLLLPKDRRDNKFCKKTINTINTECVMPYKYAFINLAAYNKHKTMEIRGHSGTIDAEKILNWIKLCEQIMLTELPEPPQVLTIDQLIETYKLDSNSIDYVRSRYAKFNELDSWGSAKDARTEGEEIPLSEVEVPVHPAFLIPVPAVKDAQPAIQINPMMGQYFIINVNQ